MISIFSLLVKLISTWFSPDQTSPVFWHKQIYPYQMWPDGIYMGSVFYAEFTATFDELKAFDVIAFQFITIEKHTRDPQTGLLYHAWDESRQMPWADPVTGCSSYFWSRAIGWYVMALVDVLDVFPPDHPACAKFVVILERSLTAVTRYQDQTTDLWWQILDQGDRPGNYLEASGASMFVYAIAKGVRNRNLDKKWQPVTNCAFAGLDWAAGVIVMALLNIMSMNLLSPMIYTAWALF